MTRRAAAILVGVWALTTFLWLQPGIVIPDGAGYFAYLPSITLDHDLLFFDEWQRFGMIRGGVIAFKDVTANGHLANHWTCGSAMAWFPSYLLGHAVAKVRNGVALPYNVPVIFTSAVAGLAALLLSLRAASLERGRPRPHEPGVSPGSDEGRRAGRPPTAAGTAALLAAVAIWFGSPLMWYSLRHATMSHAIGAAACAAVVLLSLRCGTDTPAGAYFAIGLAAGFAFAVRPQNAPFILVPLILAPSKKFGWTIAGAIIGGLPQIIVSQVLWGSPLAFANIGAQGNDWQAFTHVRLLEPIFSPYHGLAVWTPLLLFALAGFAFLVKDDRRLGIAAIAMFSIQWLMVATLDRAFWGGAAFGQRRFDNCTIFFVLGLASLFARIPRWAATAVAVVPSLWTLALSFAPLDLNVYQSVPQLAAAALHAPWRLSFVPPRARLAVWGLMLATAALLALLAWLAHFKPVVIATLYLVAFSAGFAWCGAHDDTAPWRDLIARNRAHPTGTAMTTIFVIRNEARWLEATGRHDAAQRSWSEAEGLARAERVP